MSKSIYVAGPLFSLHEREFLESLVERLASTMGRDAIEDFFLPHRDAGDVGMAGKRNEIFFTDIHFLDEADVVIALLDGPDVDSGTAVELGYAYAKRKKILGILTDRRAYSFDGKTISKLNNMIWGVCEEGKTVFQNVDDLAKALKTYLESGKL
jgi:nucleoside 2-deoxyribosyltransferase